MGVCPWITAWVKAKVDAGLPFSRFDGSCRLPLSPDLQNGVWTNQPINTAVATEWLQGLLERSQVNGPAAKPTGHSLKCTTLGWLSWFAKLRTCRDHRLILGHHLEMAEIYARDIQAAPLRSLDECLAAIRSDNFFPNLNRSRFFEREISNEHRVEVKIRPAFSRRRSPTNKDTIPFGRQKMQGFCLAMLPNGASFTPGCLGNGRRVWASNTNRLTDASCPATSSGLSASMKRRSACSDGAGFCVPALEFSFHSDPCASPAEDCAPSVEFSPHPTVSARRKVPVLIAPPFPFGFNLLPYCTIDGTPEVDQSGSTNLKLNDANCLAQDSLSKGDFSSDTCLSILKRCFRTPVTKHRVAWKERVPIIMSWAHLSPPKGKALRH